MEQKPMKINDEQIINIMEQKEKEKQKILNNPQNKKRNNKGVEKQQLKQTT